MLPETEIWQTTRYDIALTRPQVMGIVNLTPDSFSDGGRFLQPKAAIEHAIRLVAEGADILDIGAESSRPGAEPVSHELEWQRLQAVLPEVLRLNVPISVDSYQSASILRALDLGVDIINDIWALRQPGALAALAGSRAGVCLMHMNGVPATMQSTPLAGDPVPQVLEFWRQRCSQVQAAGVQAQRIVLDPGIGFGKTAAQNIGLLVRQRELIGLRPVLVGWSRKSTLGAITGLAVEQRQAPSVMAAVLAAERGASILRVHDVAATVSALAFWQTMREQ